MPLLLVAADQTIINTPTCLLMRTSSGFQNAEIVLAATGTSTAAIVVPRKGCDSASVLVLLVHRLLPPIVDPFLPHNTHKHKVGGCLRNQDLEQEVISSMAVLLLTSRVVRPLISRVVRPLIIREVTEAAVEEEADMVADEVVVAAVVVAAEVALPPAGFSLPPMDAVMGTVADSLTLAKTMS